MDVNAEAQKAALEALNEMDGPVFKMERDPRITKVGSILRRYSLDELPQFWNVLMGQMSLVGPRPPVPDEVVHYEISERRRLSMRPGITCIWQVSGRNEIGFEEWVKLDLDYIDAWSLSLDAQILAKTIPAVVFARGAQ
jgi:lipopolysaccharide/colanic/teichoic acid biosynthesis glycosyltransferase